MKTDILAISRTSDPYIEQGLAIYLSRLKHYGTYDLTIIAEPKFNKNLTKEQIKTAQGDLILKQLSDSDYLILLDEKGAERTSEDFAAWWQGVLNRGFKRVVFVIGGAYGFSDAVYNRVNEKVSLSKMTFSHQMVRLFFVEQLYRAHTILKGEPYHHI